MRNVVEKLAIIFRWLAVFSLALTVGLVPWLLGGMVPVATFTLLTGSILAGLSATLFQICSPIHGNSLPKILAPLLGLAVIGFWQLMPASEPVANRLSPSFETFFDQPLEELAASHSFSPADTRTKTAVFLSLALVSISAFQTIRTPATIGLLAVIAIFNGLLMGAVGMSLQFQGQPFSWNELWEKGMSHTGPARGFAAFINPNGAGGWLCLAFASTAGWVHWHLQKKSTIPQLRLGRLRLSWLGQTWQRTLEFLAELTVWQILSIAAMVFLAATVATTKSRGAIGALVGAIALTAAMKSSFRTLPFVLGLIMIAGGMTYALLESLELSQDIAAELETLQEFDTAVGARPQHWRDAITTWSYSPLLGVGQGSYRFATRPFSSSYHRIWFRHADNQYIETLVEAGILGLLLFTLVGWMGIRAASAATQQAKVRNRQNEQHSTRPSRRILTGLATAITLAVFTQAIAATVDFGVAMPAASSLLVLMIATLAGYLNASPDSEPSKLAGTIPCSNRISICISLILVVAAAGFLKDQWNAVVVDQEVVATHRRLRSPAQAADLDQIENLKARLNSALANRPDDPEGLRMLSRLVSADFRWQTLLIATDGKIAADENLPKQWRDWNLVSIVGSLQQISKDDPQKAEQLRRTLKRLLETQQVSETLKSIQNHFPHLLGIPAQRSIFAAVADDKDTFRQQALLSQLIDPSNAEKLFKFGLIASKLELKDLEDSFWTDSLKLSNQFRSGVLTETAQSTTASQAIKKYAPQTYEDCFETARKVRIPELKEQLWSLAEELWLKLEQPVSEAQCQLRLVHLTSTQRSAEVAKWLETALIEYPDSVPLRVANAQQLQKQGLYRKALDEWRRVLFLDPANPVASKAIAKLKILR